MLLKRSLLLASAVSLGLICSTAQAAHHNNIEASVSYAHLSDSVRGGIDVESDLVILSLGYRYHLMDTDVTLIPEISLGTGIGEIEVNSQDTGVDVERTTTLGMRAQFAATEQISVFLRPSLSEIRIDGESSDWEVGYGIGVENTYRNGLSLGVGYDRIDQTDMLSGNVRYRF